MLICLKKEETDQDVLAYRETLISTYVKVFCVGEFDENKYLSDFNSFHDGGRFSNEFYDIVKNATLKEFEDDFLE